MCIPAIKGVEIGGGVGLAGMPGIDVHDEVFPGGNRRRRSSGNICCRSIGTRIGRGLEGG